jgi:nucleoside-diphosphate-sugar epimerase
MRCLVLGAAGFLGGHVRARLDADPDVTVVAAGRSRADLVSGDLDELLRAAAPDVVVNCAGVTGGDEAAMARGNVVAVANLLAALDRGPRPVRLVHLGSAAEYGSVPPGRAVAETDPARPVSAYGMSKLAATELVLAARRRGRTATVLRVFNPMGPGTPESLLPGRLVAGLRRAASSGERARVGSLDGHRDFVDARDVAAAIRAAAVADRPLPGVLNIGSGRATALRDLAAMAAGAMGVEPPLEDAAGSARSPSVSWQQADITAATATLGWRPFYAPADSIRDMAPVPA